MHFNIHHCMRTTRKISQVSYSGHTVRLVSLTIPLEDLVSLWSQMPNAKSKIPDEHNRPSTSTSCAPSPVSFCHSVHSALPYAQSLQSQEREKNQSGKKKGGKIACQQK